ncbi:LOW QUALITY PROTEIN: probable disease resistance protein At5g63020 [Gossypium arboreum]|uniref:LOW QUALITY PROTEIN: probable disease resistance protein At5g63020 n=1 Tax=Gossypium arboreum TaxID=29729 RepID=UPI0022F1BD2F|nr:LOW QUALITY PROTEIN: probable disease resistance protein At5g63020 [Gossypium arboreum]
MGNIFSISLSLDPIITRCLDCATGQASYICNLEDNLHALQAEVAGLKELRSDLMSRVRIAEDEQQLKRLNQVEGWLSRAETLINDADQLIVQSPQHVENLCMGGCCSTHPRSSIKFGKKIAKKLQEVKDQKENGDFSEVASKPPLPPATERPSQPTVGLESNFNKVWSCLQTEQVGIIGIYGLGGVGKTTLLNQINNKFHDTTHDYHVIWAVASQDRPIERVQDQIAERIGLSNEGWKSKSLDEKAEGIFKVLCKRKFALLLDDIWEWFDLTRVGVPLPTQENGSKVIFTTRRLDVCCQMQPNMDNNIRVQCLPPGEAFKLFRRRLASETLQMHPDFRKLAEAVVQECAGLPLALVTIGRAMASKKSPPEWEYAIEVLRQSAASVFPGVGKEMYPKLKFSYDCLTSERVKSCFLYCSLYPEDYSIPKEELVDCWIGEGLLDKHTNLSSARNQGLFIIGSLIDVGLLEKEGVQLKEQPKAKKWEEVTRMSLMENQIENLTEILECPNLQTLFLRSNHLKVIINDFFNFMPMLRVLDLSRNMNLEELPVGIAKLVSLEHLNLSRTGIKKLPVELKALAKLKYLNLEKTSRLSMIPQQLISSFSKLQVLKMVGCGYRCSLVFEEMEHLKYLNVVTITFRSASELENASRFNKFLSFTFEYVSLEDFMDSRSLNMLALANVPHLQSLAFSFCMYLEEVKIESNIIESVGRFHSLQFVSLCYCTRLKDVSWIIFAPNLLGLFIISCQGLEEIINEEKLDEVTKSKADGNLFSKLEVFYLKDLPEMKTIYRHALPFPQLEEIKILECPVLKKLPLNSNSAKGQRLVIGGEEGWWKDVEWEDESTRVAFLPSFKPEVEWWKDVEWEDESSRIAFLSSFKPGLF